MHPDRRSIIRFALEHDIRDISTYSGYKGDLVVKITTRDAQTVDELEKFAHSLGIKEVVVKKNMLMQFEVYCITPDHDVYDLKGGLKQEGPNPHAALLKDDWHNKNMK